MTDSLGTIRNLIQTNDQPLMGPAKEFHRCANGGVWELIKSEPADKCFIRYTPSETSGGEPSIVSLEEFLAVNCSGPEHAALQILLKNPSKTLER